MPLHQVKTIVPGLQLAIWKITETDEELLVGLGNKLHQLDHHERIKGANARHYLASRLLIAELFPNQKIELLKDANNRPSLLLNQVNHAISITHSHDLAGILLAQTGHPGIDLERTDRRIGRVKHKFMNDPEFAFAGSETQTLEQTLIWSAKETLFKLYSRKEIDFREHLFIAPFTIGNQGVLTGLIQKDSMAIHVNITYEVFDEYVLTFAHSNHNHDDTEN